MRLPRRPALTALLLTFATAVSAQTPAKPDPLALSAESFFTPDAIQDVELSPSGRWMLMRELNAEGRTQLTVLDLENQEPGRIVAKFSRLDVVSASWVSDDWMIFSVRDGVSRHEKATGRGLGSVNRDGTQMRELIKKDFNTISRMGSKALEPNHSVIGSGAPGTNEIVVEEHHYNANYSEITHTTPRALNVATGATRSLLKGRPAPPGKMSSWLIDRMGHARVAVGTEGLMTRVYWADAGSGQWRKIAEYPTLHADFVPEYIDEKDQLYVSVVNPKTGLSEIRKFDFTASQPVGEPLIALPGFDAEGVNPIQDPGSNIVHGLRLLTDAQSVAWFNPTMQKIQAKTDELLPNRVNILFCRPCSSPKVVLIYSYSDTTPGDYLLYHPATDKFERIAEVRPGHKRELMANKELYRAKARDGADLPVWITKHEGVQGARPAVLLVHGGPWVRGSEWDYDPRAQFLATRGYVVIEPEFRGSKGYGYRHFRAGWKQWGQLMQDDVADALKFAVDKGWVDSKRVCIAGGSYGGYSALMGLARHRQLYKCGIAWVAVTDPRLMFSVHWSDISDDAKQYRMPELIGDPEKDAAMLKANAPIELAWSIKAPVLLAYGAIDRRVPLIHGEKMREALTGAGAQPEWVVYDDEGHSFARPATQIDFWRRVERFLGQHLR